MTPPPDWKMPRGGAAAQTKTKSDEDSLSSDEDSLSSDDHDVDVAWARTLSWMRSEEKLDADNRKRRAEEQEEEHKKRMSTEGYRPAFVISVNGAPIQQVESERRSAAAVAAVDAVATEQREDSVAHG
jgi:hypothetical protein